MFDVHCQTHSLRRQRFEIATWNANALLHRKRSAKTRKFRKLRELRSATVILLQETHATQARAAALLPPEFRNKFHIEASSCVRPGAGGVTTLVSHDWALSEHITHFEYVPGRILRTEIRHANHTCVFWNIHMFNIPDDQLDHALAAMDADVVASREHPQDSTLWIGGDFNFLTPRRGSHDSSCAAP